MNLTSGDIALHKRLGIDLATLEEFGIARVDDREARELLAMNGSKHGDLSGVVYPYPVPGEPRFNARRVRRDHPEYEAGKPRNKYISGYGDVRHLYFAAREAALLADTMAQIVIVEAEKSALAIRCSAARVGRKVLAIALGGYFSFRGTIGKTVDATGARVDEKGILPDFGRVSWTRRDTVIAYDTNVSGNAAIQYARDELGKELAGRGGTVRYTSIPVENAVNGPDDFIAKHGDAAWWALIDGARPAIFRSGPQQKRSPSEEDETTTFAAVDGRYSFLVLDGTVEFIADRLRRDRYDNVTGEIEVRCHLPGARVRGERDTLTITTLSCGQVKARQDLARTLAERACTSDIDWLGYLEDFTQRIWAAEGQGNPSVRVYDIPHQSRETTITAYGFPIRKLLPQILFAPGGTGKSLLALAIVGELERQGVRCLILDWEMHGGDQRARFDALKLPESVRYRHCNQSLAIEADSIRRDVIENGIEFLLIDSIVPACNGPAEDSAVVQEFHRALSRIHCGSLAVAHTRSEDGEQRPFGSVFWHNLARDTWFLKRVESPTEEEKNITLGVYHRKSNFQLLRPFGLTIHIDNDPSAPAIVTRVAVRSTNIADVGELAASLPLWRRIQHRLKNGGRTIAELSNELDAKPDTVKKALTRQDRTFQLITSTKDGIHRWGLREGRYDS